ncbi:FxsA family protein [Sporolactobacillus sp. CPB3-1]|uniref:FxsA family protein n=1 Tax=Sporolactobacillus mangiferae TaxID=2940498 RepID=A0ABT0M6X3_9BACL|nr:FxsA family protein [Sporolactobacillus mangiferae]MCL1630611.1 FxsA family protein [Sporolactobacillus mangiferae]
MIKKVLLLLLLYVFAETGVLIYVGGRIGALQLFLIVFLSMVIGIWMVLRQGLALLNRIRDELRMKRIPGEQLLDGACLLLGGLLLCSPGLISDLLGVLLLVPSVRVKMVVFIKKWIRRRLSDGSLSLFLFRRH